METTFDHNKLIKKIAKERLKPYDITQIGNSRTFLYDNGWGVIFIDFAPSAWSKGTDLSIGVDFNFYPRSALVYTYGSREKAFKPVGDEAAFTKLVNDYCDLAIRKVEELKAKFKDVRTAKKTFKKAVDFSDTWDLFNLGILCGLMGQLRRSKILLKIVKWRKCKHDWEFERRKLVIEILTCLDNQETFLEKIKNVINQSRQLKKLPPADLNDISEKKTAP